ncbi:MAG: carbonic anhydrase [Gammaproteobacteria bacterium]|nr:carbonic anhydrase [Gammaproteobacteria bacterium]
MDETLEITSNVNEMIIQGHYGCKAVKAVLSELGYLTNNNKDNNTTAKCPQQPLNAAKEILANILILNKILPDNRPNKLPEPLLQAIAAKKPITDQALQLQLIELLTKQLILKSIENTLTHPELAERVLTGELTVYGWYYNFKNNCIEVYRPNLGEWRAWDPLHDSDFHEWYNALTPSPSTAPTLG